MIIRCCAIRALDIDESSIKGHSIRRLVKRADGRLLNVKRRSAKRIKPWGSLSIDHRPLLACGLELLHVADARSALGLVAILNEVRDRNSGQNGDDGDHDHDFNEGKTLQEVFHGCVPFFVFVYLCRHHADTRFLCNPYANIKEYTHKT